MPSAPPTRIHLVRHGQVANPDRVVYGRLPGWGLSDEGVRQAETLAEYLSRRSLAAVYTSPLERALQTAERIARACGAALKVDAGLTESGLSALWQGMRWWDVRMQRREEWEAYRRRPLEMEGVPETLRAMASRMTGTIRAFAEAHPGQELAAISHGDPIRAAVLTLTGDDLARLHDLQLPTGSLVTLDLDTEGAAIVERWPALKGGDR